MPRETILVAGAGVFGLSAALELLDRGYEVTVLDAGKIPCPLAASTDISKVCRMEYGSDETYMGWMEQARDGWLEWNEVCQKSGERGLYHETGVLMVTLGPMQPGGFECESFRLLNARGHSPERIGGEELTRRFPAWSELFVDGFYHEKGGYAESGRVVEFLARRTREAGGAVHEHCSVDRLLEHGGRVTGVHTADGGQWLADRVVLACGSWLEDSLPELRESLQRTYHPVWHLRPRDPSGFEAERFPVFTADVSKTGFYGFPLHEIEGVVKVAHHGQAVAAPTDGSLTVPDELTANLRSFLAGPLPGLADAEVVSTRLCPYCDTQDGDFWVGNDPQREGLTIAGGGSGHAFKFSPLLGAVTADAVEDVDSPLLAKFGWRPELRLERGREATRCHGPSLST